MPTRAKTPEEIVTVLRHALLDADKFRAACELLSEAQQTALLGEQIEAMGSTV